MATSDADGYHEVRSNLYRELTTWLHRQNERPQGSSFWDRPIAITLIGSVLLGLITTGWQMYEKRWQISLEYERNLIKERTQLLKEFASSYVPVAQIINGWYARVVWIADETNKRQTKKTAQNILAWKKEVRELEAGYTKAESLEGVLTRIEIAYACPSVRMNAKDMASKWEGFVNEFQTFNRRWNDLQKLPPTDIVSTEKSRKDSLATLESSMTTLLEKMSGELFFAQGQANKCPV